MDRALTLLLALLALLLAACAAPEPPLCRVVQPPAQWVDYCRRVPADPDC